MRYGLISTVRELAGASRPTSVPAELTLVMARGPRAAGTPVRKDSSFFQRTTRRKLIPHTWGPPLA